MFRIGQSTDIHNLVAGDHIILGQTKITCPLKVEAISDGDVLTHAICEAIIGALGLGDLGDHFPEGEQKQGFSSIKIIEYCNKLLELRNYEIGNIDSLIILDSPKLSEHKINIRNNLTKLFKLKSELLNIKATTSERNFTNIIQVNAVVILKEIK
ncbi:2-C-methyl-D-erythritol 2,4-cyclodiphosphate synthase [Spiroplasma alleghenense]|uniref:2-C-methyl-D-erythritol 2,4-cyclodiphosphate synthase n=1 Tax=Spiroplasma alleghenense TaxID=216931 RepID=A0A345Z2S7_9MOLU|nr:2-C-methyl-D-erythritol 2,4-cyclodiphosphate synthase [Spiroplasma alleghenense]AXK50906.1 2-C-methyl-D-erythritol 2,4-cyclodiphosphate synthase [Spiroplasma alleghenense]